MALSGSFYSYPTGSFGVYCSWSAVQNIPGYYSDVTVKVYISHYSLTAVSRTNSTIKCGSETYTYTSPSLSFPSGTALTKTLIGSKTFRVNHDSGGGTKKVVLSASWQFNGTYSGTYVGTITASSTITLDAIPQQSAIASVSVDSSNKVTVNLTRYVSTFTHMVKFVLGTHSYTASSVGTSTSYTIPSDWFDAVPNSVTGIGAVQVTTYSGDAKIGNTVNKEFIVTLPSTAVPTIGNITWTKTSSEPNTWPITKGVSTGTMSMTNVAGIYGSTIVSRSLTFAGLSSNTATLTVNGISTYGTLSAVAKVTDSRGRTATKTVNFTVANYTKPTLTVTVYRSNASGVETATGDYMAVKATAAVTSVGDNAVSKLSVKYKQTSASAYTETTLTSGTQSVISASSNNTWDWIVTASDKVNTVTINGALASGAVVLDILANGKGMKFGGVAEADGLSSAWDLSLPNINATNKLKGATVEGTTVTGTNGTFTNLTVGGVAVADMLKNSKDYIVEQGTSGIWTYRKWNSGIAECWGSRVITGVKVDQAWGNLYNADTPDAIAYPFTFTSTPVEVACMGSNNMSLWMACSSINTSASTGKYFAMRPNTASTTTYTVTINYQVVGRWK